jgi:hypothetical protein
VDVRISRFQGPASAVSRLHHIPRNALHFGRAEINGITGEEKKENWGKIRGNEAVVGVVIVAA